MSQCFPHLRFNGLHRNTERARDLRVAKALSSAQLEHFATAGWQLGDCIGESAAQFRSDELRRARGRDAFFADEMRLGTPLYAGMAQVVERTVARRAEQVRP